MKKTIVKTLIATTVVAFTGCGVDGGGGGGSSRNLDINLEKGVRLVKRTHKDLKRNTMEITTYAYDDLNRLDTKKVSESGSHAVYKYTYIDDLLILSRAVSTNMDSKIITEFEYDDISKKVPRATKLTITTQQAHAPVMKTIQTWDYSVKDNIKMTEKTYIGSRFLNESKTNIKMVKDKHDRMDIISKLPNGQIVLETNTTFAYDSLNRVKSQKNINKGPYDNATHEYITTYSKNRKTASPTCYIGRVLERNKMKFDKYPQAVRVCYLQKSKKYIHTEGKVKKESVSNFEYKINDENLVTESKSERFIETYEYEEYESN